MSHATDERYVRRVLNAVVIRTGGYIRTSRRNVPHIVTSRGGMNYSVCYFKTTNKFRVFWPWGNPDQDQSVRMFATVKEVVDFLNQEI